MQRISSPQSASCLPVEQSGAEPTVAALIGMVAAFRQADLDEAGAQLKDIQAYATRLAALTTQPQVEPTEGCKVVRGTPCNSPSVCAAYGCTHDSTEPT